MAAPTEKPVQTSAEKGGGKSATDDAEIERLTDKVYRLMMQDVRLEHARGPRGGS
jgi:hypothetical protein